MITRMSSFLLFGIIAIALIHSFPQLSLINGQVKNLVILVNQNGSDSQDCLEDTNPHKKCQTIEFVANRIGRGLSNAKIIIESDITISGAVMFERCSNVSIGGENFPTILCNCSQQERSMAAGFTFINVQNLLIANVTLVDCCGSLSMYLNASLAFQESTGIMIRNVTVQQSMLNPGLMLIDCYGEIDIHNSMFIENSYETQRIGTVPTSYAAGLHMQFSGVIVYANVSITHCLFDKNSSPRYDKLDPDAVLGQPNLNGYSLGGGLGIVFLHNSTGSVINVHDCIIKSNNATNGGGLCIHFQDTATDNVVTISNSLLLNNTGRNGGGGVMISLGQSPSKNHVQFKRVTIERNFAIFGAGTSIAALFSSYKSHPGELVNFSNCIWVGNSGVYSPAVDVSPFRFQQSRQTEGFLPIPLFAGCRFKDHFISRRTSKPHVTLGVLVVTRFSIHFQGSNEFLNNSYSALYLTSGHVVFQPFSQVLFASNVGIRGGAISANGFSTIVVNDNSRFHFINNTALTVGGAIYYASSDQREYFEGRSCFLRYAGNESDLVRRNLSFNFANNSAVRGLSIYSESLFSCLFAYVGHYNDSLPFSYSIHKLLEYIGEYKFDTSIVPSLATGIRYITFSGSSVLSVIPGDMLHLPLGMRDEFQSSIKSGYQIRVPTSGNVHLSNYFTIDNTTRVFGIPGNRFDMILSTPQRVYNLEHQVTVKLVPCPPGFVFDKVTSSCRCSSDIVEHSYPAIIRCNHTTYEALIYYGFWVGYYPENTAPDSDHLYTALFPFAQSSYGTPLLLMPNNSDDLPRIICGSTRTGVLCGKCRDGYSTRYHSKTFVCGDSKYCNVGVVLFFLSEIIPSAIFFTIVITFGISFSSGNLNGFVFFSQILDIFSLEQIHLHSESNNKIITALHHGHRLIYGMFNFNFFPIFPFCLWKGATIMDLVAFKYVTTVFALILILSIVAITNYSNNKGCMQLKRWAGKTVAQKSSVLHGISTLLIISYSQCTRASLTILAAVYLRSKPGIKSIHLTYYEGLPYLEGRHLLYAIPAIIVCLTIVILPPLCLLLYPSLLHVLALCKLSEHGVINCLSTYAGIGRLMPLFDSFQGCYKDKLRFFSGLYFMYRVAILLAFTYSELTFYVMALFLVLLMLGVHSVAQPYRQRSHNIIDSLIFLNLAIINVITVILKMSLTTELVHVIRSHVESISLLQIFFVYLPIITLLLYGLKPLVLTKCNKWCKLADRDFEQQSLNPAELNVDVSHTSIELVKPFL